MFNHIYLLALLLAPVMAYLAAALIFGLVENRTSGHEAPVNSSHVQ